MPITTGGLGPTVDDLTKDAVARAVGTTLELHEPSLRAIEDRFRAFGRTMSDNNRRQAYLPKGCVVLENPHGTAPGFIALRADGKFVACMPGVPREMKPMLDEKLIPWLVERFALRDAIYTRTLHTVGIGESELDRRVEDLFRTLENPKIAMLAHGFRVDVKLMAKAKSRGEADALIEPVAAQLRERIGAGYYGDDDTTLAGAIVRRLARARAHARHGGVVHGRRRRGRDRRGRRCVGGVSRRDRRVRERRQVRAARRAATHAARRAGAVSEETAVAMARGARARLGVDVAISTTGIAGPEGGSAEKPVGLVWFALAFGDEIETRRVTFPGNRADVRERATVAALGLLWRRLEREAGVAEAR